MGCCTSTDRKVELLFEKFQMVSLANLNSNNSQNIPTLVCGRIMPVNEVLICPVKERQCIYYETKVSRYENNDEGGYWVLEFTETEWRDFYLYDPQNPQMKLYIPARQNRMIVRGVDDGHAASGAGAVSFFQSEQLPNGIQQLLNRHNYQVEVNVMIGNLKKRMNYEEESYDINEQIACLGFIQDGIDAMGQPVKIMHPIQTQSIPESYFQENHWEKDEIKMLKELCNPSSIVSTDDRKLFRGIEIMMPQVVQPPMMPQVAQGVIIQQPPLAPPQYQQPVQYPPPPQYQQPPLAPPPQYQQSPQYPPPQYQQPPQYHQQQQPVQGYYPIPQQMNGEMRR